MFPFTFGRTIEVPITGNSVESVSEMILDRLAGRIKAQKPSSISSNPHQITFSGGFFRFVGNWNLLVAIDYGVIDVVPDHNRLLISYNIRFIGLFILSSLMTIMFAFAIFSSGFTLQNLVAVAGIWLWFFGGNFIIAVVRFHNFVRSALAM